MQSSSFACNPKGLFLQPLLPIGGRAGPLPKPIFLTKACKEGRKHSQALKLKKKPICIEKIEHDY